MPSRKVKLKIQERRRVESERHEQLPKEHHASRWTKATATKKKSHGHVAMYR